jgi:hypothetical protein
VDLFFTTCKNVFLGKEKTNQSSQSLRFLWRVRTKDLTKESVKRRYNCSLRSDGVTYIGEAKTSIEIMLPVN